MKTDVYTKVVLTIIAVCLVYFVINNLQVFPTAKANDNNLQNKNYVSVPVKPDGSIDVNVKKMETMDVNIEEVGGMSTGGEIDVHCNNCSN